MTQPPIGVHGDIAANSPSQSVMDNYIVSVQNTRQMCHSTRKHMVEHHLNAIAALNNLSHHDESGAHGRPHDNSQ